MLERLLADKGLPVDSPGVIDDFDRLKKLVVQRLSRKISEAGIFRITRYQYLTNAMREARDCGEICSTGEFFS